MLLYQRRDFGALLEDTLNFFRKYGANYFKTFFILNGGVLLLLLLVIVLGFFDLFKHIFSGVGGDSSTFFVDDFAQNSTMYILVGVMGFVLILLLSLVMYAFPVLYMKRMGETGGEPVSATEMWQEIKKVIPHFFKFFFVLLVLMIPLFAILIAVSAMLALLLIGLVLILALVPLFVNFINLSWYDYLHRRGGLMQSFSFAANAVRTNFWKYSASFWVVYLILQVVTSIFTFVPMIIMTFSGFLVPNTESTGFQDSWLIFMAVIYIVSILVSFVLTNVLYINAGLMYYDSREDLHRGVVLEEIDNLGSNA
ncbi:MAG: hypothetical protein Q4F57_08175 [Weeksellaceae bacterium]|nr:hypothetical protein [Weeksellaceae bacterium]